MLRSRMFTPAFRFFAALAAVAAVGAFIAAVGSSDQGLIESVTGPLSIGWKGAVGNHLAYTVLVSLMVVAGGLAGIHIAFRDADPQAEAEVAHTDSVPLTRAPAGTNFLPILGAFAMGILVIGQITNKVFTWAGLALLFSVIVVWMLRTWAERATGDAQVNREIYQRFIEPLRVPVLSIVCIAVVVVGLSRVLLAVSEIGAVVLFGVVGSAVLLIVSFVAARPAITKNAITIFLFVGAIAVIAAGIAAAVVGERDFEHEKQEGGVEHAIAPSAPSGPITVHLPAPGAGIDA